MLDLRGLTENFSFSLIPRFLETIFGVKCLTALHVTHSHVRAGISAVEMQEKLHSKCRFSTSRVTKLHLQHSFLHIVCNYCIMNAFSCNLSATSVHTCNRENQTLIIKLFHLKTLLGLSFINFNANSSRNSDN